MREIKFRAWDKTKKEMICVNPISSSFVNYMTLDGKAYRDGKLQDWELMQYTGLKDVHGVEIYESDICYWRDSDGISRIDQVNYGFSKFFLCNSCNSVYEYIEHSLIVVGNIYQNPELLKVKTRRSKK